ncbi:MAG: hypothetical protein U1C74_13555 [Phenylobacterium sp.]|nr:hypothetical protein [Phenylobacterium sp.]
MKRAAAVLGTLCLVLLLLAFDERGAERAFHVVRDGVGRAKVLLTRAAPPPAPAARGVVLMGRFEPAAESAAAEVTGAIDLVAAEVRFEKAGTLKTQPHRIAYGREPFAAPLGAAPADQLELRRIVPGKGQEAVAATPACSGEAPGWIALLSRGQRLDVLLFRPGPAPGTTASEGTLCGSYRFEGQ